MKFKFEDKIVSYLADEMSEKERSAFLAEVDTSLDLKRELESYETVWRLTNQLEYSQDESDTSWEFFQRKIEAPFNLLGLDWLKIAASITLLAVISFGMWFFGSTDINLTTKASTLHQQLADETSVKLDYNSHLTYDENFSHTNRAVSLEGQAYFDVAHSSENFKINCTLGEIIVFGTSFNLLSTEDALVLELIDGSVMFNNRKEQKSIEPGERLLVNRSGYRVEKFEQSTVWDEDIQCTNAPLVYILEQLSLVYNVQYDLPKSLLKDKYTVKLPKNDIAGCLKILTKLSGQNFALINQNIVLQ